MKKGYVILISTIMLLVSMLIAPTIAFAVPFETETIGPNSELVPTQQVYTPTQKIEIPEISTIGLDEGLTKFNNAEDMVFDEENKDIYVADTGNKRIVKLNDLGKSADYIDGYTVNGEKVAFKNPKGLAINDDYLLVADKELQSVVIFNKDDLSFNKIINRPSSTLIGTATIFAPIKVRIDDRENIYVVSEGNTKGVMQLNYDGEFMGYIGANETSKSFMTWMKDLFNIQEEDSLLASGNAVSNIALDHKGLIYTITYKSETNAVKKLNTTGVSIMSPQVNYAETTQVCVDQDGNIFSVRNDGYITVLDSYGNLLFSFGGENKEEVLGALQSPVAISVSDNREIFILDKQSNMVIRYQPTHFANLVFDAVNYYKDGLYIDGEPLWAEILKYNAKFILAYKALAKANMKRGNYDEALHQFKLAEDKAGYSNAYWEIRDNWLRHNLGYILIPLICLVALVAILKLVDKKKPVLFTPIKRGVGRVKSLPLIGDVTFIGQYFMHTRDAVYEMKYKNKSNIISATIFYVLFVAIQIIQVYLKGYLFNNANVYNSNALEIILFSTLPLLLIVICNYFVSTVTDGEGKFKQVYIGFIYALAPYLIFAIPLFLLSNVLTYNEQVIYDVLQVLIYGWCGINIFLMIMELHDYSFWKALKNILLTLICCLLFIAFAFIIYMLCYQFVSYIISVIKELSA